MSKKKEDSGSFEQLEHYEKKIYDQKQLLEISKALNSTLDYNYLIDAILNICLAQLQTLNAAIYLAPDVDADHFTLDSSHKGFDISDKDMKMKIMIDSPLVQNFEEKPKAMTIRQLSDIGLSEDENLKYFKLLGAEMIIPLNAKGKVNGLLVLGEKMTLSDFLESEKDFLTILASLAGVAVENSRLYELSTVDMMTQLKIHHYFQSKLREEMDRCRKKGTKLALLFTDIDKFKVFNDTHGHQEFCVIMPGADLQEGFEMGEKIRKAVEAQLVENPNGGDPLRVTISVGVTEFYPTDKNNKELIERADKALYQAKHGGRNQTVCYKVPT